MGRVFTRGRAVPAAAMLLSVIVIPSTAAALTPPNDQFDDRIAVAVDVRVDFTTVDATFDEATDYEAVNAACGLDLTGSGLELDSIWYDVTTTRDQDLLVEFAVPDSAFAEVMTGDPGSFVGAGCSFDGSVFHAVAGTTYHIMISSAAGSTAGSFVITAPPAPPPAPTISFRATGTVHRVTNALVLSGTAVCSGADWASTDIDVRQRQGRMITVGFGFADIGPCDGVPHRFTADVPTATGLWRAGVVVVTALPFACNVIGCTEGVQTRANVRLTNIRTLATAPPPPSPAPIAVTIDRRASLDLATNLITLTGTFRCAGGDLAIAGASILQTVQRTFAAGDAIDAIGVCDGRQHRWSLPVLNYTNTRFSGGPATVTSWFAGICVVEDCAIKEMAPVTVRLVPTGHRSPRTLEPAFEDPAIVVRMDPLARLNRAANTVSFGVTIACTGHDLVMGNVIVVQRVGRVTIRGAAEVGEAVVCDGAPHRAVAAVRGENGRFTPGPAVGQVLAVACTLDGDCVTTMGNQPITIRPR